MDAHGEEVACVQRRAWMELPQNRFLRGIYLLVQRYLRHNVGMQGAALAFYLLFMIFPLLIFVSSLLGLLQLDVDAILAAVQEFLPREIVSFIGVYLTYVGRNPSVKLLLFGLFFSLYFPMRATNTLMRSVRIAYHLGPPRGALPQLVKTLLYTAVAGYFALFFLYALSQDGRQPWRNIWPGTMAALGAWLALNWLYSTYVENFADYSLLYGSIGTAIALLIWLYMTAVTLIMGAELNATLISLRKDLSLIHI